MQANPMPLNRTHDPSVRSWLASANGHPDFPLQNLPFAVFRRAGSTEPWRGGVALGDQVLDLEALRVQGLLSGDAAAALVLAAQNMLNAFMAQGPAAWQASRHALFALLRSDASAIIELTKGGKEPITLAGGEQRAFLHDNDTVILRGWCEKAGAVRIGFGECRGTVLPALSAA